VHHLAYAAPPPSKWVSSFRDNHAQKALYQSSETESSREQAALCASIIWQKTPREREELWNFDHEKNFNITKSWETGPYSFAMPASMLCNPRKIITNLCSLRMQLGIGANVLCLYMYYVFVCYGELGSVLEHASVTCVRACKHALAFSDNYACSYLYA
jgi:hypothetical protein